MVQSVRAAEKALGEVTYRVSPYEESSVVFRRSIFVVEEIRNGENFTEHNIRSIRPGYGLSPKFLQQVLGMKASCDLRKGTPLEWKYIIEP
jgi:pseudaminic acid synthase